MFSSRGHIEIDYIVGVFGMGTRTLKEGFTCLGCRLKPNNYRFGDWTWLLTNFQINLNVGHIVGFLSVVDTLWCGLFCSNCLHIEHIYLCFQCISLIRFILSYPDLYGQALVWFRNSIWSTGKLFLDQRSLEVEVY